MKMYYNNQRQVAQNKHYPNMKEVLTKEDLTEVVTFDHVGAAFKDNCRSNANFVRSDCSMFDVDNAKAKGKAVGRPTVTADSIPGIFYKHYPKYKQGEINKKEFSRLCNLSYPTIYKYLNIIEGGSQ